mgnify:CR=1 FL=1
MMQVAADVILGIGLGVFIWALAQLLWRLVR